jgi:hypothetical protein
MKEAFGRSRSNASTALRPAMTLSGASLQPIRVVQTCLNAHPQAEYAVTEPLVACRSCGELLDVSYEWPASFPATTGETHRGTWPHHRPAGPAGGGPTTESALDFSGVWRFPRPAPILPRPEQRS